MTHPLHIAAWLLSALVLSLWFSAAGVSSAGFSAAGVSSAGASNADRTGPDVVASIRPVQSLVWAVTNGVVVPELIVEGAGSPHAYSLKPSKAEALERAEIVFRIGDELETFLSKPIRTIAAGARTVDLIDGRDVETLPIRQSRAFADHGPDEAGQGHDNHHDHDSALAGNPDSGAIDPHIWLDPHNAKAIVRSVERALIALDPANADTYSTNANEAADRLDRLVGEISAILDPVRGRPYIVFHDSYHYFEDRFGVRAAGAITLNPEVAPGARALGEIRSRIAELDVLCVFSEPQFPTKTVSTILEGTQARPGVLDPLGASVEAGPELYFTLMRDLAGAMRDCLAAT